MRGALGTGLRYLAKNRRRTALTVLGIALSAALICGTALIGESMRAYAFRVARECYGSRYATIIGIGREQVALLRDHAGVAKMGTSLNTGAHALDATNTLRIDGADGGFLELSNLRLSGGRWPAGPGEIAVERWALKLLDRPALGSTVTLRIVPPVPPHADAIEVQYVLCGIIENRDWSQQARSALAVVELGVTEALREANALYEVSLTTRRNLPIQETLTQIRTSLGLSSSAMHQNAVLLAAMQESTSSATNDAVFWLEAIVTLVVLFSTVGVIYNSFAISVAERTREFGLLRAAGATPDQVRAVIYTEASLLCLAGIPLGVASGVGAILLVFHLFAVFTTGGLSQIRIEVTLGPVAIAAAVGALAVFLSALLPAVAAGRTSPLAAIGSGMQLDAHRPRRGIVSRLLGGFSVEAELAWLNTRRNRKRFAITVFSMSIGVALFVFFSSLARFMDLAMSNYAFNRLQQDLAVYLSPYSPEAEITLEEADRIKSLPFVSDLRATRYGYASLEVPSSSVTASFRKLVENGQAPAGTIGEADARVAVDLFGLGDRELELSRSGILHGNPSLEELRTGVLVWPACFLGASTPRALDIEPGDSVVVLRADSSSVRVPVVGIIDQPPSARNLRSGVPALVLHESLFTDIAGARGYASLEIGLREGTNRDEAIDEIEALTLPTAGRRVVDEQAMYRNQRNMQIQLGVMFYGLIAVVSLIGATSIVNTISTNLVLRVREFGTIRATGMTVAQLRLMVLLEGVFTGLAAAILGALAGCGVSRALHTQIHELQEVQWLVPWDSILLAASAALVIGALSSLLPFRRIARLSVVEAIRGIE